MATCMILTALAILPGLPSVMDVRSKTITPGQSLVPLKSENSHATAVVSTVIVPDEGPCAPGAPLFAERQAWVLGKVEPGTEPRMRSCSNEANEFVGARQLVRN